MTTPPDPPRSPSEPATRSSATSLTTAPPPGPASGQRALVHVPQTQPAPPAPLRLARSLDEADRRSLLHIDGRGRVRSPARYRALDALGYTWAGLLVAIGIYSYAQLFGAAGALIAAVVLAGAFTFGAR